MTYRKEIELEDSLRTSHANYLILCAGISSHGTNLNLQPVYYELEKQQIKNFPKHAFPLIKLILFPQRSLGVYLAS